MVMAVTWLALVIPEDHLYTKKKVKLFVCWASPRSTWSTVTILNIRMFSYQLQIWKTGYGDKLNISSSNPDNMRISFNFLSSIEMKDWFSLSFSERSSCEFYEEQVQNVQVPVKNINCYNWIRYSSSASEEKTVELIFVFFRPVESLI